jgi:hypothetical protein
MRRVARPSGHPDVHEDDVGLELAGALDGLLAARRLAHDDDDVVGELERGRAARVKGGRPRSARIGLAMGWTLAVGKYEVRG